MSTIKIKRSGTSSQTPSSLEHGELALNYADGKLFYKDASDNIAELSTGGGGGGGLDSAAVSAVVDETVNDPTQLILGTGATSGVRIGSGAYAHTLSGGGVAIGPNTSASHNSVAIGTSADAGDVNGGTGSVSIGSGATHGGGNYNTAVGRSATTSGSKSVALGYSSEAGNYGIAIGDATSGQRSIAIGALANASLDAAIHINANYNSGVGPTAAGGLVIETQSARLEYSADSDWVFSAPVTSSEFKFSDGTSMTTAPTGGGAGGGLDSAGVQSIVDDNILGSTSNTGVTIGPGATASSSELQQVVIGPTASSNGQFNVAIGRNAKVQSSRTSGTAVGNDARVGSSTGGNNGVAIGTGAVVERDAGTAIGPYATTKNGSNGVAVGMQANAWGASALALGHGANATTSDTIAIGANTSASTQYGIDIGTSAAGSLTYDTTNDWTFGATVNVNGDINASGDITAFSTSVSSDPRLKTDIVKIGNAVEKVQMLNGVSWDWTRGGKSAGVLSTDVAAVLPEAVTTGKIFGEDTEYDRVNYNALIGLLVEAVKELQEEVNDLRNKG
jgi:hypothetical protein